MSTASNHKVLALSVIAKTIKDWRDFGHLLILDRAVIKQRAMDRHLRKSGYSTVLDEIHAFLASEAFKQICDMADVHPDAVRRANPDLPWSKE